MTARENILLNSHLTEQGLNQSEIDLVYLKLHEYDRRTMHESVFDSIENGTFNLQQIIEEVKSLSRKEVADPDS